LGADPALELVKACPAARPAGSDSGDGASVRRQGRALPGRWRASQRRLCAWQLTSSQAALAKKRPERAWLRLESGLLRGRGMAMEVRPRHRDDRTHDNRCYVKLSQQGAATAPPEMSAQRAGFSRRGLLHHNTGRRRFPLRRARSAIRSKPLSRTVRASGQLTRTVDESAPARRLSFRWRYLRRSSSP